MWRTIGQSKALAFFENSFKSGNLARAYLLVGPPHVGKTTLAIDVAQALNCQEITPPCGECHSCRKIITAGMKPLNPMSLVVSLLPGHEPQVPQR